MKLLLAAVVAAFFAVSGTAVVAADTKDAAPAAKSADVKLEKPANITQEAWNKMSDAEKKKAVEAAAKGDKTAAKKEKKGGC
jgi:hypothetical protein